MSDSSIDYPPSSIDFTLGNPLLSLVAAVLRAALYVLNLTRKLITFATLTIPRLVVTILQFSWTLQVRCSSNSVGGHLTFLCSLAYV